MKRHREEGDKAKGRDRADNMRSIFLGMYAAEWNVCIKHWSVYEEEIRCWEDGRRHLQRENKTKWVRVVWACRCNDFAVKLNFRGRRRENDRRREWERKKKIIKVGGNWGGLLGNGNCCTCTHFDCCGGGLPCLTPGLFSFVHLLNSGKLEFVLEKHSC